MFDNFLVEARLKLVGGWRSVGWMEGVRNVLKVSELNNRVKERASYGQPMDWRGAGMDWRCACLWTGTTPISKLVQREG